MKKEREGRREQTEVSDQPKTRFLDWKIFHSVSFETMFRTPVFWIETVRLVRSHQRYSLGVTKEMWISSQV